MKAFALAFSICVFVHAEVVAAEALHKLAAHKWYAGTEHCTDNKNQPIETYQLNKATFILRQSKCVHYEAPFIYLLLGSERALLLDTGATKDSAQFPIQQHVAEILSRYYQGKQPELFVVHSHGHPDHYAGDAQFKKITTAKVVGIGTKSIESFYQFDQAALRSASIDLGGRVLKILHTPGHEVDGITIYDAQMKLLLTGDLIYPGRLLINSWQSFKQSLSNLVSFAKTHQIDAILGGHVELSADNKVYEYGLTHHPDEASLVLVMADLQQLYHALEKTSAQPEALVVGKFHIIPLK